MTINDNIVNINEISTHSNSNIENNELLLITTENGLQMGGLHTIIGFSTSSSSNFEWYVNDTKNSAIIVQGNSNTNNNELDIFTFSQNLTAQEKWDWEVTINFSASEECSCLFEITQHHNEGEYSRSQLALFVGDEMTNYGPILLLDQIGWVTGDSLNISGIVIDDHRDTNITFDFSICKIGYCGVVDIPLSTLFAENITLVEINEKISSFTFEIFLEQIIHAQSTYVIDDGEWRITGSANNEGNLGGNSHTKPVANISAYKKVIESTNLIMVDASHSNDFYWGRDALKYDWKIEEDGFMRAPTSSEILSSNILGISSEDNGTIMITLTVRDATGLSNSTTHQIVVANSNPTAVMSIDGKYVNYNEVILLGDNDSWPLQSISTDTPNDISTLQHSWYFEGVLMDEGENAVLTSEYLYKETEHKLTLKVTDNDGAEDMIAVWIKFDDSKQDSFDSGLNLNSPYLILVLMLIPLAGLLFYTRKVKGKTRSLPKWKK